jgi:hypothetical protein
MNSIKLSLLLFLTFIVTSAVRAQDLMGLIPQKNSFIGVVDINKIKSKAGFAELANLPYIEKMAKSISEKIFKDSVKENSISYLDLGKYGINTDGKAYFYFKTEAKVYYGVMLIPLKNEAVFTSYVKKLTTDTAGSNVTVKNNLKFAAIKDLRLVWNDKAIAFWSVFISPAYKDSISTSMRNAIDKSLSSAMDTIAPPPPPPALYESDSIATVETPIEETIPEIVNSDSTDYYAPLDTTYNYDYNYESTYKDPYAEVYGKVDSICKGVTNEWCALNEDKFLMDKGVNSLSSDQEFTTFVKSQPDVAMVLDYGQLASLYMSSVGRMGMGLVSMWDVRKSQLASIMEIYKGVVLYAKIEHNKDDIELNVRVKYSNVLNEIYKEVKKKKIQAGFLKYMSRDLMGYYAAGIDIKGVSKGVGNYLKNMLPQLPQYGPIVVSAMDVLDIFIDEERLYNIFSGDVVFAVNGVKPTQVIHTSYKYDDDYNRTEVIDTTTQMRPEVLLMLGLGNQGDVEKILKLFKTSQLLKQEGNYYGLAKNNSSLPVYFRIHDNILFITNSQSFAENPVVCADGKQLDKVHANMFKKNTSVLYLDIANITGFFAKDTTNRYHKDFTSATGLFSGITMYGANKQGYAESKCVLKLKETSDNAMVDIIKFINAIFENKQKVRYE